MASQLTHSLLQSMPPSGGLVRVLTQDRVVLAPYIKHPPLASLRPLTELRKVVAMNIFGAESATSESCQCLLFGPATMAQCLRRQPVEILRISDLKIGLGKVQQPFSFVPELWVSMARPADGAAIQWLCDSNREQAQWYLWLSSQQQIPVAEGTLNTKMTFPVGFASSIFPCIRECQQIAPAAAAFYDRPEALEINISGLGPYTRPFDSNRPWGTVELADAETSLRKFTEADWSDELMEMLKDWVLAGTELTGEEIAFAEFIEKISALTFEMIVALTENIQQAGESTSMPQSSVVFTQKTHFINNEASLRNDEADNVIVPQQEAIYSQLQSVASDCSHASNENRSPDMDTTPSKEFLLLKSQSLRRRGVSFHSTITTNTAQLTSSADDKGDNADTPTANGTGEEENSFFMPLLDPTDEAFNGPTGATSMLFTGDSRIGIGLREEGPEGAASMASIGTRTTTTSTLRSNRSTGESLSRQASCGRIIKEAAGVLVSPSAPSAPMLLGGNSVMQVEDNEVEAREIAAHVLVSLHTELPPLHHSCSGLDRAMYSARRSYVRARTLMEGEMDVLLQPMFTPYNRERGAFAEEWGLAAMSVDEANNATVTQTEEDFKPPSPVVLLPNAGTLTLYLPKSRLQRLVGETSSRLQQLTNGGFVKVSDEGAKPNLKSRVDRYSLVNDHINIVKQFDLRTLVDITPTIIEFHRPAIFSDTKILDRENARDVHEAAKQKNKSSNSSNDARLTAMGRRISRIDSFASPYIWSKGPHSAKESLFGAEGVSRVTTRMHKYRCYGNIGLRLAFAAGSVTDLDSFDQRLYRIPHIIVNLSFVTAQECTLFFERISLLSSRFMVAALRDETHVLKPYWYDPNHPEEVPSGEDEPLRTPLVNDSVTENAKEALTSLMSRFNKIKKEAIRKGKEVSREVGLELSGVISDSDEEEEKQGLGKAKLSQQEKDQLFTAQLAAKAPQGLVVALYVDHFLSGAPQTTPAKNLISLNVARQQGDAGDEDDEDQKRRRLEDIPSFTEDWLDCGPLPPAPPTSQLQICRKARVTNTEQESDVIPFSSWQLSCVTCKAFPYQTPDVSGDGTTIASTARLLLLKPISAMSAKRLLGRSDKTLLLPIQSFHIVVDDEDWGNTFDIVYDERLVAHYLEPVLSNEQDTLVPSQSGGSQSPVHRPDEEWYINQTSPMRSPDPVSDGASSISLTRIELEASPKIRKRASALVKSLKNKIAKCGTTTLLNTVHDSTHLRTLQVKCRTFLDRTAWIAWLEHLRGPLSHDYKRRLQEREMEEKRRVLEAFLDEPIQTLTLPPVSSTTEKSYLDALGRTGDTVIQNEVLIATAPEWMLEEARRVVVHEMFVLYDGLAVMEGSIVENDGYESSNSELLGNKSTPIPRQENRSNEQQEEQTCDDDVLKNAQLSGSFCGGRLEEGSTHFSPRSFSSQRRLTARSHDTAKSGLFDKKVPIFSHLNTSRRKSTSTYVVEVTKRLSIGNELCEDDEKPLQQTPRVDSDDSSTAAQGRRPLSSGSSTESSRRSDYRDPSKTTSGVSTSRVYSRIAGNKDTPSFGRLVVVKGLHHPFYPEASNPPLPPASGVQGLPADDSSRHLHFAGAVNKLLAQGRPQQQLLERSYVQFAALCTAVACDVLRIKEGVDSLVDVSHCSPEQVMMPTQGGGICASSHQLMLHLQLPTNNPFGQNKAPILRSLLVTFLQPTEMVKLLRYLPLFERSTTSRSSTTSQSKDVKYLQKASRSMSPSPTILFDKI